MASKPGLDVRDWDLSDAARQRSAKSARRVALDDQQVRWPAQLRQDRRGDALDVQVRILRSWTVQPGRLISPEAMVGGVEVDMLAGEDQARADIASAERPGDGGKLDRFGASADDEPDIRGMQTSPSFGRINLHP
jgi:hypothetical protein